MNVYPVKIELDGKETTVSLKLDARHLRELEEKMKKNARDIILEAYNSMGTLCDVLTAAMDYKGNTNPDMDGYDLVDALTDAGKGGELGWPKLMTHVGIVSGVFSREAGLKIIGDTEDALTSLLGGESPAEENPT